MRVFISYSREYKEIATKLEVELHNRNFDTFLDIEKLNPTDAWRVEIERNIKKSSVFIILYDSCTTKQSRFFNTELEIIKHERKKNAKKIITVTFPPTTEKDLPPFLNSHQLINGNEDYWTWSQKVINEIDRLRNIQKEGIKQFLKKVILPITMLVSAGLITAVLFYLKTYSHFIDDATSTSESVCASLKGDYHLKGSYVYLDEQDIKATSYDGALKADYCKPPKEDKKPYVLHGYENTRQKIEIKINNIYQYVADATNESESEITIGNDGKLGERQIFYPPIDKIKIHELYSDKEFWKHQGNADHIRAKLKEYENLLRNKHRAANNIKCTATLGKNESSQDVIAFICPRYIRVMVNDRVN